ncbi:hypothetical protein Hokovirus_3_11 [Hokovirus HKV1]|uniref:Uncharacterized protein n=1 Tax=Hokovirus HKV1 TaxID=1977638 RepID=A0A1V0SGI7_9VIRU|nr:hypothetical protein Hokovirus_3_11 [Hokovirus HKV1]
MAILIKKGYLDYVKYNNIEIFVNRTIANNYVKYSEKLAKILDFIQDHIPKTIHKHIEIYSVGDNYFKILNKDTQHYVLFVDYKKKFEINLMTYFISYDNRPWIISKKSFKSLNIQELTQEQLTIIGLYISLGDRKLYLDDVNNFNVILNYIYPELPCKLSRKDIGYRVDNNVLIVYVNIKNKEYNKYLHSIKCVKQTEKKIIKHNNLIRDYTKLLNKEQENVKILSDTFKMKSIFNNSLDLIKNNNFKLNNKNQEQNDKLVDEILNNDSCRYYIKYDIFTITDRDTFVGIFESVLKKEELDLILKYHDSNEELKTLIKALV